jgi:ribosomal protein S18 acetylase RimI-like enzyme
MEMLDVSHELQEAVEVYFDARGRMFADLPDFRVFRAGPLRGFHRHPHWPEQDAFYALGVEPHEAVAAVREYEPHPHHMITVFTDRPEPLRAAYEGLGYKSTSGPAQPFMWKCLDSPPDREGDEEKEGVRRVSTAADLEFINSADQVMESWHLHSAHRYYYIKRDGVPVCTGRYVLTSLGAIYVAGLDTIPAYRRQGLAKALMERMHRDAVEEGGAASVLCSSPIGLGLYRALGYEVLTCMHGFVPNQWGL